MKHVEVRWPDGVAKYLESKKEHRGPERTDRVRALAEKVTITTGRTSVTKADVSVALALEFDENANGARY